MLYFTWALDQRDLSPRTRTKENRLIAAPNGSTSVNFAYDALGRRIKRSQISFGTNLHKYTYDGSDVLLDDINGTITKYQNGPGIDDKLKTKTGTTSQYYLQDHLGSTVALTNSSGAVTESESYDSFGNRTNKTFSNRYQFTGREYDPTTGLQYSRARWYDPQLGRFISEDPIGFAGGNFNLYGYVHNSSVSKTDPLGRDECWLVPWKYGECRRKNDDKEYDEQLYRQAEIGAYCLAGRSILGIYFEQIRELADGNKTVSVTAAFKQLKEVDKLDVLGPRKPDVLIDKAVDGLQEPLEDLLG